jgi:soluble lytic murein transglycosylase-like protein
MKSITIHIKYLADLDNHRRMSYSLTMKTIIVLSTLISLLTVTSNATEETPSRVPHYVREAAVAFKIDANLMYAICTVESNCRSRAINRSDSNKAQRDAGIVDKAYGLFQIKKDTAIGLGFVAEEQVTVSVVKHGKLRKVKKTISHIKDLLKPDVNSYYAAKLLHQLYKRYHDTPKVVSAYNAGHSTHHNKEYVLKVLKVYSRLQIDKKLK